MGLVFEASGMEDEVVRDAHAKVIIIMTARSYVFSWRDASCCVLVDVPLGRANTPRAKRRKRYGYICHVRKIHTRGS